MRRLVRLLSAALALTLIVAPLLLAGTVGEAVALILACAVLADSLGSPLGLCLGLLGGGVTFFLAMATHEAGHAVAGRWVGWPPVFVHVGPVALARAGSGWRARFDRRLPWLRGRVETAPGPHARWRLLALVAAGPAANLAAAALAMPLLLLSPSPVVKCWAGLFAAHSLFLGAVSLLPVRERGYASDGLQLWSVATGRGMLMQLRCGLRGADPGEGPHPGPPGVAACRTNPTRSGRGRSIEISLRR